MENEFVTIFPTVPLQFEPDVWNGEDCHRRNCYNYALNARHLYRLDMDGTASSSVSVWDAAIPWREGLTCKDRQPVFGMQSLNAAHLASLVPLFGADPKASYLFSLLWLLKDGLEPIHRHSFSPETAHIIAYDHEAQHFYRLDVGNIWSHKFSGDPVSQFDAAGKVLDNLEIAFLYDWNGRKIASQTPNNERLSYYRIPDRGMALVRDKFRLID